MRWPESVFRSRTTFRKSRQVSLLNGTNFKSWPISRSNSIFCYQGKEHLEELKKMKKVNEPILTVEEKASKINKAEIKGTGF